VSNEASVLVLGGGVGGLVTAVMLRKKLGKEHRIVLVDRAENHLFAPSLLWLMTGDRKPDQIARPLERLTRKNIDVVRGEIERIDPAERRVTVAGRQLVGDYLVISLGAELNLDAVPGLGTGGHCFYTLDRAERLRDALKSFRSGRLVVLTATPAYKCPAAPYEAAMLLEAYCRKKKIRGAVQIDFYAAEPGPMGVAGREVSAGVRRMVEAKGIGYHPEHQIVSFDPDARRLSFANGVEASFDLLAYVPEHRAPRAVRDAGMVAETGWVSVDRYTMETRFPRVFAIGDVTGIPLQLGKPLPKAGVFAHGEAEVVAANIAQAITGRGKSARFLGHGECFIEAGDGKAGFGEGDFYAEPTPQVKLHKVGRRWHAAKVLFEKTWLRAWF
jgi:sulfide:quinone oxidoreductase